MSDTTPTLTHIPFLILVTLDALLTYCNPKIMSATGMYCFNDSKYLVYLIGNIRERRKWEGERKGERDRRERSSNRCFTFQVVTVPVAVSD